MSIKIIDSPTKKVKRVVDTNFSRDYAPSLTYDYSPHVSGEYAPTNKIKRYVISNTTTDYSPSVSRSFYGDYAPSTNYLTDLRVKYSPSTNYQTYDRYAPYTKEVVVYEPVLVSRFKPQPILISNADMINSYFRYLIDLLSVLR